MTTTLQFSTLDVFTTHIFQGNQLAIVHMPHDSNLSQEVKQAIAREFNFSETVFLYDVDPGLDSPSARRINIFTTAEELPFAGHPVIGTISYIGQHSQSSSGSIELTAKAGAILAKYDSGTGLAQAEIPHDVRTHQQRIPVKAILGSQPLLGHLIPSKSAFPLVSIVKGMSFALVELSSLDTELAKLGPEYQRIDHEAVQLDDGWAPSFTATYYYVIVHKGLATKVRTRMLPGDGSEDAATGSAASTLASCLALQEGQAGKTYEYEIEQGVEMGRRSQINVHVTLTGTGKEIAKVMLAGHAVLVTQGTLCMPGI